MRQRLINVLRSYFSRHLLATRHHLNLTQAQMARRLSLDTRSYVELDHGSATCSALTLALYLVYLCDDPQAFLSGLRADLDQEIRA